MSSLSNALADVEAVEQFVERQKENKKRLYASIEILPHLLDKDATLDAIRGSLRKMATSMKEDDVAFVFLAGHGVVPAGQEMFFSLPHDAHGPSLAEQRKTGFSTAMIAEAIRNMPSRRVVLVVDACQSGGISDSLQKVGEAKAEVEARLAKFQSNGTPTEQGHGVGIYILAAATPLQQAWESGKAGQGHSWLTQALLEALDGQGEPDGTEVRMRDMVRYAVQRLTELAHSAHREQTPLLVTIGLDFPISIRGMTEHP